MDGRTGHIVTLQPGVVQRYRHNHTLSKRRHLRLEDGVLLEARILGHLWDVLVL